MKTVVVFSGGLDSTVLLAKCVAEGRRCYALSVNYGQRHAMELEAARAIAEKLGVAHQVADLSCLRPLMSQSSQTNKDIPVPHGHYAEETMKLTVVPNRNMLLLAVAGAWAINLKADSIAYGAHAGDHAIYPDCREKFVGPMAMALACADWHPVGLERPFLNMSKADIVGEGAFLGAPLALSYSCYEGQPDHCGECGTCVERKEAFAIAGVKDPTRYKA